MQSLMSIYKNWKFQQNITHLDHFRLNFEEEYYHVWNQRPRICQSE